MATTLQNVREDIRGIVDAAKAEVVAMKDATLREAAFEKGVIAVRGNSSICIVSECSLRTHLLLASRPRLIVS